MGRRGPRARRRTPRAQERKGLGKRRDTVSAATAALPTVVAKPELATATKEKRARASPDAGAGRAARGARRRRRPRRGAADRVLGPEDVRPRTGDARRPDARG